MNGLYTVSLFKRIFHLGTSTVIARRRKPYRTAAGPILITPGLNWVSKLTQAATMKAGRSPLVIIVASLSGVAQMVHRYANLSHTPRTANIDLILLVLTAPGRAGIKTATSLASAARQR